MGQRRIDQNNTARAASDVDEVLLVNPNGTPVTFNGSGASADQVQGTAADNAASAGNPVWVAAKYFSSTQAYAGGDVSSLQANASGHLLVGAESTTAADGASNSVSALCDRQGAARGLWVAPYRYNGTTWDRDRKPGASASRIISSAASENATVAKASAGDLHRILGRCAAAAAVYLKIYNKASAPSSADTPALTLYLAPGASFAFDLGGQYFSAGISYRLVTGGADNDATAVAAGDVLGLNVVYA